jgi:hypothetical protein
VWSAWGGVWGAITPRTEGDRLAFTFGYNDFDETQVNSALLRWRNAVDPFSPGAVGAWGDILFSEPLDSVLARQGKTFQDVLEVARPRAYGPNYPKMSEIVWTMFQEVVTGKKTPVTFPS